jgi:hypothetical protein
MKYPFPIKSNKLILTQAWRVSAPVDMSKALSITTSEHLGVDIVCGTPEETWGKECTWPFPFPGTVYDAEVDSPMGAKQHAHSQIDGTDPITGIQYSLIYIHLSSVTHTVAPGNSNTWIYQKDDVIGKIGNNGVVYPAPTPQNPLGGTHLHLGVGIKKPGDMNFTMVDPLTIFELIPTVYEETPYEKLIKIADSMISTNPRMAGIVRAVAGIVRSFM